MLDIIDTQLYFSTVLLMVKVLNWGTNILVWSPLHLSDALTFMLTLEVNVPIFTKLESGVPEEFIPSTEEIADATFTPIDEPYDGREENEDVDSSIE